MKNRVLAILKNQQDYISGEALGEMLGVSRTAVWKAVSKLKQQGYCIEAQTNKGYRLLRSNDLLNEVEILQGLRTQCIGKKVIYKEEVDSTNNVLKACWAAGEVQDGCIAVAQMQTGGKGRLGREWISMPGGLWFSILLKPNIVPQKASMLTLIAGLCVCKAVREVTGLSAGIKWPNDVMIGEKKICGILTEMSTDMESVQFVVVGIGLNVNMVQFPEEISPYATSLRMESGFVFERRVLLQKILELFESYYMEFIEDGNFLGFHKQYCAMCITLGEHVTVKGKDSFTGRAVDITEDGELVVEKDSGKAVVVFSGEVSIRKV